MEHSKINHREYYGVRSQTDGITFKCGGKMRVKKQIGYSFALILTLCISGCNSLLKSNKLYNSHIYRKGYNEDKHKFDDYASTSGAIIAIGYDRSAGFVRDNGGPWHWIGRTGWVTKENYSTKMQPFTKFLEWSALPKSEQESTRLNFNKEVAIKRAGVEFRFFNDGSPAFVDLADASNWSLGNVLFDRSSDYYSVQDINKMVMMINDALEMH